MAFKIIKEEVTYQGKLFALIKQFVKTDDGHDLIFELARRAPGTRLLIVDLEQKTILLTREYRSEIKGYDYRLPGGKVFNSLKDYETFLETGADVKVPAEKKALEEAREEAGIVGRIPELFHISHCGASVDWDLYYYVVSDWDHHEDGQALEIGEDIHPEWHSFEEAKKIALKGQMHEDRSVGVLLRWLEPRKVA